MMRRKKPARFVYVKSSTYRKKHETLKKFAKVLNEIASWTEGEVVDSAFDCPVHAEAAREALKDSGYSDEEKA